MFCNYFGTWTMGTIRALSRKNLNFRNHLLLNAKKFDGNTEMLNDHVLFKPHML